jgi:hypothetical protein
MRLVRLVAVIAKNMRGVEIPAGTVVITTIGIGENNLEIHY